MIIIYVMFMIVTMVLTIVLAPITFSVQDRGVAYSDYKNFQKTVDHYSIAIENEIGSDMAAFFKGSANLMIGNKRRARSEFLKAKQMGKQISQKTFDLCN